MNSGMGNMPNAPMSGMPTPKSKAPAVIITTIVLAIIIAGVAYAITSKSNEKVSIAIVTPTASPSVTTSVSPSTSPSPEVTTTPTAVAQSKVYSNTYMSVTIPGGWSYSATQSGAVNITKDNYILYINPRAQQASGIQGGRYGEIAGGAPSSDAVNNLDAGNAPCTPPETHTTTGGYSRYDYYVSNTTKGENACTSPSDGSNIWYFSYLSKDGGYFNHTTAQQGTAEGYVITMAYNSKNVNALPKKGNATLNAMLAEMTSIASTLKINDGAIGWYKTIFESLAGLSDWEVTQDYRPGGKVMNLGTCGNNNQNSLSRVGQLHKGFNDQPFKDSQELETKSAQLTKLISDTKSKLQSTGWVQCKGPTEGGFYNYYLYVKSNKLLALHTGERDAVTGGMYVTIQFEY